jgi:hypothetical protein
VPSEQEIARAESALGQWAWRTPGTTVALWHCVQTAAFSRDGLLLALLLILEQFEEPVMLQRPDEARAGRSLTCRDPP